MRGFTHINQFNNKASLISWHVAEFGSDSYIGQYAHICLRALKCEIFYASTTYKLNWGVITY